MAEAGASTSAVRQHSRRSTRGPSLLQNSLLESVPTGLPADERLRILLRRCFKRALQEISDEIEPFQEHHHAFLVEGLALFDDTGDDDDRLTKLLKAATEPASADTATADVAAKHHAQLKALSAECNRWNELLSSDTSIFPNEQCAPEAGKTPADRQCYYDAIDRRAELSKRAASQYAVAMQNLLRMRDQGDCGEAEEVTCDKVDEASILDV